MLRLWQRPTQDTGAGHSWDVDDKTVCHSCAAKRTVEREFGEKHKDDKPFPGRPMADEGRIFTVRLYGEE